MLLLMLKSVLHKGTEWDQQQTIWFTPFHFQLLQQRNVAILTWPSSRTFHFTPALRTFTKHPHQLPQPSTFATSNDVFLQALFYYIP